MRRPVASFVLGVNIVLCVLFSNTLNLCRQYRRLHYHLTLSLFYVGDQVLYLYKTEVKLLCVLITLWALLLFSSVCEILSRQGKNRLSRRIFRHEKGEVTGGWKQITGDCFSTL